MLCKMKFLRRVLQQKDTEKERDSQGARRMLHSLLWIQRAGIVIGFKIKCLIAYSD